MPRHTHFIHFIILALVCSVLIEAFQLQNYQTNLGVDKDEVAEEIDDFSVGSVVYTSVVEYQMDVNGQEGFSDPQLAGLAKQAWDEMLGARDAWIGQCPDRRKAILNSTPRMISIIAVGKNLYIASGLKRSKPNLMFGAQLGGGPNAPILNRAIVACNANLVNPYKDYDGSIGDNDPEYAHRRNGNCAEITATGLGLKHKGQFPWELAGNGPKARVIAYGVGGDPTVDMTGHPEGKVHNPCLEERINRATNKWAIGCMNFVDGRMNWIREGVDIVPVTQPRPTIVEPRINMEDIFTITRPAVTDETLLGS